MNINAAIDAFSHAGGNRLDLLQALCPGRPAAAEAYAAEISGLQQGIMEVVRARSGEDGLSREQVEQCARDFLASARPDIGKAGLRGLLRYVLWIAWHDGWLELENKAGD